MFENRWELRERLKRPNLTRDERIRQSRKLAQLEEKRSDNLYNKGNWDSFGFRIKAVQDHSVAMSYEEIARLFVRGKRPRRAIQAYEKAMGFLTSESFSEEEVEDKLGAYTWSKETYEKLKRRANRIARAVGIDYTPKPFPLNEKYERAETNFNFAKDLAARLVSLLKIREEGNLTLSKVLTDMGIAYDPEVKYETEKLEIKSTGVNIVRSRYFTNGDATPKEGERLIHIRMISSDEISAIPILRFEAHIPSSILESYLERAVA